MDEIIRDLIGYIILGGILCLVPSLGFGLLAEVDKFFINRTIYSRLIYLLVLTITMVFQGYISVKLFVIIVKNKIIIKENTA